MPRRALTVALVVLAAAAAAQEVTLPLDRYDQLRALANPQPTPTPAPVVPLALEEARLEVAVAGGSARVVQRLTLSLLAGDWQRLPLPANGSLVAADLGGLAGRLEADGGWALVVRGEGRHEVRLESLVAVATDESSTRPTWRLDLALPQAAVVAGTLRAGAEVESLEVEEGGLDRGRDGQGRWSLVGSPGATMKLRLEGAARAVERATLPLRFGATTATRTVVSRTRRSVSAWVDLEVGQGRLTEVRVPLPEGLEVVTVGGDPVAGWDVVEGVLVVTPAAPVEGRLSLSIALAGDARAELSSPVLAPAGAARVRAVAAVALAGDGLLEMVDPGSGRLASSTDLEGLPAGLGLGGGHVVAVTEVARPPRWSVTWPDAAEVLAAQVDRLLVDVLAGEAGQAAYQVWAEVRSSGAPTLNLAMPAGFRLESAGRDGAALVPGLGGQGLVVPLAAGGDRQVVHLAGLVPLAVPAAAGRFSLPIPALSAPVSRVEVRLQLPGSRRCRLEPESRRGAVGPAPVARGAVFGSLSKLAQKAAAPAPVRTAAAAALYPEPPGFTRVEAAWSALASAPGPLEVAVEPAPGREEWF